MAPDFPLPTRRYRPSTSTQGLPWAEDELALLVCAMEEYVSPRDVDWSQVMAAVGRSDRACESKWQQMDPDRKRTSVERDSSDAEDDTEQSESSSDENESEKEDQPYNSSTPSSIRSTSNNYTTCVGVDWSSDELAILARVMANPKGTWRMAASELPDRSEGAVQVKWGREKKKRLKERGTARSQAEKAPGNDGAEDMDLDDEESDEQPLKFSKSSPHKETMEEIKVQQRRKKVRRWTEEEDEDLLKIVKKVSGVGVEKWNSVRTKLGKTWPIRSADAVNQRYNRLNKLPLKSDSDDKEGSYTPRSVSMEMEDEENDGVLSRIPISTFVKLNFRKYKTPLDGSAHEPDWTSVFVEESHIFSEVTASPPVENARREGAVVGISGGGQEREIMDVSSLSPTLRANSLDPSNRLSPHPWRNAATFNTITDSEPRPLPNPQPSSTLSRWDAPAKAPALSLPLSNPSWNQQPRQPAPPPPPMPARQTSNSFAVQIAYWDHPHAPVGPETRFYQAPGYPSMSPQAPTRFYQAAPGNSWAWNPETSSMEDRQVSNRGEGRGRPRDDRWSRR